MTHSVQPNVRIAVAQFDPRLNEPAHNTARAVALLEQAAREGAALAVLPECALTGYNFASLEEARQAALPEGGEALRAVAGACRTLGLHAVVGTLLRRGDDVLNAALLYGPDGLVGAYHKAHLPFCGADRYIRKGDTGFPAFDTPLGRIGMLICYDLRFPEASRALALRGADLIALPTNWPTGADSAPEFTVRARAFENRVFFAACNRVGVERGSRFIGRSCIVAPSGRHLADAAPDAEQIIYADVDLRAARNKRLVVAPGEFEMDFFGDRRPELYGDLTAEARQP